MNGDVPFLDYDRIKDRYWRFYHQDGPVGSEVLKFLPDGRIGGYNNDNETFWQIRDGVVSLLHKNGDVTVTFDSVELHEARLLLMGRHYGHEPVLCLREQIGRVTDAPARAYFADEITNLGWSIGDYTYGTPAFIEKGMAKLSIGKYCSIGEGVKIAFGNHRVDCFTTYPFQTKSRFWEHVPPGVADHVSKGDVIIGHDVWIGTDVFIGSGVRIGSGAVLGAKSVITRDVPAYAIVVGNPGRIARYRFEPHVVEELLQLAWWDLPAEIVDSLLPFLMSDDVPAVLAALRQANETARNNN